MPLPSLLVYRLPESVYSRWAFFACLLLFSCWTLPSSIITIVNQVFLIIKMRRQLMFYHRKMVGTMANWILYGILWVQVCKWSHLMQWIPWANTPVLRFLLHRLSEGQSRSQNGRLSGACARNNPKRGHHKRHCPILHLCIYRFIYDWRRRQFVVLGRAPDWLEYVLPLLFKRSNKRPSLMPRVRIRQSQYSLKHFIAFELLCWPSQNMRSRL